MKYQSAFKRSLSIAGITEHSRRQIRIKSSAPYPPVLSEKSLHNPTKTRKRACSSRRNTLFKRFVTRKAMLSSKSFVRDQMHRSIDMQAGEDEWRILKAHADECSASTIKEMSDVLKVANQLQSKLNIKGEAQNEVEMKRFTKEDKSCLDALNNIRSESEKHNSDDGKNVQYESSNIPLIVNDLKESIIFEDILGDNDGNDDFCSKRNAEINGQIISMPCFQDDLFSELGVSRESPEDILAMSPSNSDISEQEIQVKAMINTEPAMDANLNEYKIYDKELEKPVEKDDKRDDFEGNMRLQNTIPLIDLETLNGLENTDLNTNSESDDQKGIAIEFSLVQTKCDSYKSKNVLIVHCQDLGVEDEEENTNTSHQEMDFLNKLCVETPNLNEVAEDSNSTHLQPNDFREAIRLNGSPFTCLFCDTNLEINPFEDDEVFPNGACQGQPMFLFLQSNCRDIFMFCPVCCEYRLVQNYH